MFELKIAEEEFRVAQLVKKIDSGVATDLMPNEIQTFSKKKAYNMRPLYPNVESGIDITRDSAVRSTKKMRKDGRK